jgi:DNA gyrase subunit A
MNINESDRVSAVARMVAHKKKAARVDPMQGALELGVPAEDDPIDIGGEEVLDETMIDDGE